MERPAARVPRTIHFLGERRDCQPEPALAGSAVQHAWVALQAGSINLMSNPVGLALWP
jgi:hypothetical protein